VSPVEIYATVLLIAVCLGVGSILVYSPPTRPCHQCGARLAITSRLCRHCGYRFTV